MGLKFRRLASLRKLGKALVVAAVVLITFPLVRVAEGDATVTVVGVRGPEEARQEISAELDLDEPLPEQFAADVRDLARDDLGSSLIQPGRPVNDIIGETLPMTLSLNKIAAAMVGLVGIPLGPFAALSARLEELARVQPIVGEVRGDGFFLAVEPVKDRHLRTPLSAGERARLISEVLLPGAHARGLHVKLDDRIELAALVTPPFVAGTAELDLMASELHDVLDEARSWAVMPA